MDLKTTIHTTGGRTGRSFSKEWGQNQEWRSDLDFLGWSLRVHVKLYKSARTRKICALCIHNYIYRYLYIYLIIYIYYKNIINIYICIYIYTIYFDTVIWWDICDVSNMSTPDLESFAVGPLITCILTQWISVAGGIEELPHSDKLVTIIYINL